MNYQEIDIHEAVASPDANTDELFEPVGYLAGSIQQHDVYYVANPEQGSGVFYQCLVDNAERYDHDGRPRW
jgi:hypothetical protein